MGDRILPSIHIQQLKAYIPRVGEPEVKRVTSVLEPDTLNNQMEDQYAEAKVSGCVVTEDRKKDIADWESDYKDILTKKLGLTSLKEFKIKTGDHAPIQQCPCNTPQSLRESIDKELAWLQEKGFIRLSESP